MQNKRIRDVVSRILADTGADDATKATRFRANVQNLSEPLARESLTTLWRRIGGLPQDQWGIIQSRANLYLRDQKQKVMAALDAFEGDRAGRSLAEWWNDWSRTL
jgi:hypothetical protein